MRSGTYGLLALFALVMIALSITPFSWAGWIYEDCGTRNCYCEPFRGGYFVRQPWTAASNYGYIVAGVLVLRSATGRNSQTSQRTKNARTGSPKWYGISLLLAGCFSFFSHASLTRVGEWFDLMGVYLLAGTLLGLSLRNIIGYAQISDGILAAFLAGGAAQMAFAPDLQMLVIASLLISITAVEIWTRARRKQHGPNRFLLAGAALFALGVLVWSIADQQGGCLWGGFPGHTVWHVLSAGAVGVMYQYYFPHSHASGEVAAPGTAPGSQRH